MTTKAKYALASIAILTSFAAGRWMAPTSIKTDKETSATKDTDKHKVTVITVIEHPDGTKESKTTEVEDTSSTASKNTSDTKDVERSTSKVTISALGGISLLSDPLVTVFGVSVTKPILGPITAGVWGLSNKTFGASLGLTF